MRLDEVDVGSRRVRFALRRPLSRGVPPDRHPRLSDVAQEHHASVVSSQEHLTHSRITLPVSFLYIDTISIGPNANIHFTLYNGACDWVAKMTTLPRNHRSYEFVEMTTLPHDHRSRRFDYRSLNLERKEIRLVQVLASQCSTAPIQCRIEHFDLTQKPTFKALSYRWGSEKPASEILLEGRPFYVRQNLYDFLSMARSDPSLSAPTWLFIDQITINQNDKKERGHQVAQIADVYSNAKETIMWLGNDFSGSGDLLAYVNDLIMSQTELDLSSKDAQKHTAAAHRLLENPYWTRLWICQEMVLAKRLRMYIGTMSVDWDAITWANNPLPEYLQVRHLANFIGFGGIRMLYLHAARNGSKKRREPPPSLSWPELLSIAAGCQCEDRRDQVYGLMALLHPSSRVTVDYSCSPYDVWVSVAKRIAESLAKYWTFRRLPMVTMVGTLWVLWVRLGLEKESNRGRFEAEVKTITGDAYNAFGDYFPGTWYTAPLWLNRLTVRWYVRYIERRHYLAIAETRLHPDAMRKHVQNHHRKALEKMVFDTAFRAITQLGLPTHSSRPGPNLLPDLVLPPFSYEDGVEMWPLTTAASLRALSILLRSPAARFAYYGTAKKTSKEGQQSTSKSVHVELENKGDPSTNLDTVRSDQFIDHQLERYLNAGSRHLLEFLEQRRSMRKMPSIKTVRCSDDAPEPVELKFGIGSLEYDSSITKAFANDSFSPATMRQALVSHVNLDSILASLTSTSTSTGIPNLTVPRQMVHNVNDLVDSQ